MHAFQCCGNTVQVLLQLTIFLYLIFCAVEVRVVEVRVSRTGPFIGSSADEHIIIMVHHGSALVVIIAHQCSSITDCVDVTLDAPCCAYT